GLQRRLLAGLGRDDRQAEARSRGEGPGRSAPGDQQQHRERGQARLRAGPIPRGHWAAARGGGTGVRDGLRPDRLSLTSGAAVAALGTLVLFDSAGVLDVSLWVMAVILAGFG